jgi:molecular chaperone GrpE (heat shock protein)
MRIIPKGPWPLFLGTAALAAALALPALAAGQDTTPSVPPAPPPAAPAGGQPAGAVQGQPAAGVPPATSTSPDPANGLVRPAPRPLPRKTGGAAPSVGGATGSRPSDANRETRGARAAATVPPPVSQTVGPAASGVDSPASAAAVGSSVGTERVTGSTGSAGGTTGGDGRPSLVPVHPGTAAAAAFALLLAGQMGVIVILHQIRGELRSPRADSTARRTQMSTPSESDPRPLHSAATVPTGGLQTGGSPYPVPEHEAGDDGGNAARTSTVLCPGPVEERADGEEQRGGAAADELQGSPKAGPLPDIGPGARLPGEAEQYEASAEVNAREYDGCDEHVTSPDEVRSGDHAQGEPVEERSHALYLRARKAFGGLLGAEGKKDRVSLAAATVRFDRYRGWLLALHDAWENEVDYAYLTALQKPGAGAVADPFVMVYAANENDWEGSRRGLRELARHIEALPEEKDENWPALLPHTTIRKSVDYDLRIEPREGLPPAAEMHARRVLATLVVNLKSLRKAREELGRLVRGLADHAGTRLADTGPEALSVLDAVCAPGCSDEEREAAVAAAEARFEALDHANFAVVRAAEERTEKLAQGYRRFLKMLVEVVDGLDRARALHEAAPANGGAGYPGVAAWGGILAELDDLLVRRVLRERLEVEPIECKHGDSLDTDIHNPLGSEVVAGLGKDRISRIQGRGFAYADDGRREVVRPVGVIVANP